MDGLCGDRTLCDSERSHSADDYETDHGTSSTLRERAQVPSWCVLPISQTLLDDELSVPLECS